MNDCWLSGQAHTSRGIQVRKASGVIAAIALLVALAGCAGGQGTQASTARTSRVSTAAVACSQVGTKKFAKTRFLLHAGLGLGAFKKFVYDPFKAEQFKSGSSGRVKSVVLAGAAALFAYHELKVAKGFAEADKTLCKLVAPLDELTGSMSSLGSGLKSGKVDDAALNGVSQQVASVKGSATSLGAPITERAPPPVALP
jgi:hypothetical protein